MRVLLAVVALCAFMFAGCGPDAELVASGKAHKCKLLELAKKVQAEPTNTEVQAQIKTTTEDYMAVVETAEEGKRADLEAAINEAVAKGCE